MVSDNLRYRFDNGHWRVEAGGTYSTSRTWRRALQHGHFQNLATSFNRPIRVEFHEIAPLKPGIIRAYDNNNQEVDISEVSNYVINTGGVPSYGDVREEIGSAELNVRRQLDAAPFPAAIQVGGACRRQERDIKLENQIWTFNGIGGNRSAAPFAAILFNRRANYYGFYDLPWISPDRAVAAWKSDPSLFTKTAANIVSEESFRRTRSEYLKEDTSALYFQLEAKLLRNRLQLVTGARYESTTDDGLGPRVEPSAVWVRNPDGTFARNSAGNRIRRPEAGAVGSLQQLDLTTHERGARARRSYDGYYPSLHVTYNLTENLLVRAAYAKSYARPDLDSVIPNTVVDEFDLDVGAPDPSLLRGNVTLRNTGIKPWTADNYDVSIEYYTDTGGVFTVGGFQKEIKDFFGAIRRPATQADIDALGLDPQYLGWELRTEFNAGDARISGLEFSIRHSLAKLGRWGKYFDGFVNGTKLNLEGDQDADFRDFMPEILNWGITFSRNPVTFMAKWHSRGTRSNSGATAVAPDGFVYDKGYTTVDLNFTYQLGRRHSLFVNVRNVAEVAPIIQRYGSATPPHARQFRSTQRGAIISAGIRGTF